MKFLLIPFFLPLAIVLIPIAFGLLFLFIVNPSFFDNKHFFDKEEMETRKLQGI